MEKVRSFKLKNNGAFVVRIHVLKLINETWQNITPSSGYRDITLGAERTVDLQSIPKLAPGEKVKLKAEVAWERTEQLLKSLFTTLQVQL